MIIDTQSHLCLFGHNKIFNLLKDLHLNKNLPNKIILSGDNNSKRKINAAKPPKANAAKIVNKYIIPIRLWSLVNNQLMIVDFSLI